MLGWGREFKSRREVLVGSLSSAVEHGPYEDSPFSLPLRSHSVVGITSAFEAGNLGSIPSGISNDNVAQW